MPYESIIQLIDSEVERLSKVRQLLAHLPALPTSIPAALQIEAASQAPAQPSSSSEEQDQLAAAPAAAPTVQVLKPVVRQTRQRKPRPVEPRALGSAIPAGPVVVSREMLAQRRAAEAAAEPKERAPEQKSKAHEGSLEALVRDLQARGLAGLSS